MLDGTMTRNSDTTNTDTNKPARAVVMHRRARLRRMSHGCLTHRSHKVDEPSLACLRLAGRSSIQFYATPWCTCTDPGVSRHAAPATISEAVREERRDCEGTSSMQ